MAEGPSKSLPKIFEDWEKLIVGQQSEKSHLYPDQRSELGRFQLTQGLWKLTFLTLFLRKLGCDMSSSRST